MKNEANKIAFLVAVIIHMLAHDKFHVDLKSVEQMLFESFIDFTSTIYYFIKVLHGNYFNSPVQFYHFALRHLQNNKFFFGTFCLLMKLPSQKMDVSLKNIHYWSVGSPHWLPQVHHQRQCRVTVWCGIISDRVFGHRSTLLKDRYQDVDTQIFSWAFASPPGTYTVANSSVRVVQHDDCPRITHKQRDKYSAFSDKPERNCHFSAPGRNCMTHRQALQILPIRVKNRSIKIIQST
jgi:hypothetical protein